MSRLEYRPDPNQEDEEALQAAADEAEIAAHHRLALPDDAEEDNKRFQAVENLLRNAPLLSVPIGFADRVIAALKGQNSTDPDYQDAMGIIIGLFLAALIAVPLFGTPAYLIGRALFSDAALSTLIADLETVLTTIMVWLQTVSLGPAFVILLLVSLVGVGLLSGYVLRFVKGLVNAADDS